MDYDYEIIRELFNDAFSNYGEKSMPYTFLEDFAKAQGFPKEDAVKIIELIKQGSAQPEFTNFPGSTINWNQLKIVPEGHINRSMFNFEGTQRYLKEKYPINRGGILDYKNLNVDEQNKLANNFFNGLNQNTKRDSQDTFHFQKERNITYIQKN